MFTLVPLGPSIRSPSLDVLEHLKDEDIIGNIEAKNIDTSTDDIDDKLVETITEPESITSKDAIEMISKLRDFFVRKTED
ncbi:hypothetical protein BpHYR1_053926, partial [Brachionus plicatilis]